MKKIKTTRKVYVVISETDICGDLPSIHAGRKYDIHTLYDYAIFTVFEKKQAAINWKIQCDKSWPASKSNKRIVRATLILDSRDLTNGK